MVTVFTFKDNDRFASSYWAYDDETNLVSGSFRCTLGPYARIPDTYINEITLSLADYTSYVAMVNGYSSPPIIVAQYSRDTHPEYFI